LKKRTKKLSLCWTCGADAAKAHGPDSKKFFAPLFFKKAAAA
jgi:hypothetical protein